MRAFICEGVDSLVNEICKHNMKDSLNNLLAENFPDLFSHIGYKTFLAHLFTIPLPIRDKFVFFMIISEDIVVAFGMLDNSNSTIPIFKNVCRNQMYKWKGVGKHVLFALDKYAKANNLRVVELNTNNVLIDYYGKYGWKIQRKLNFGEKEKVCLRKTY